MSGVARNFITNIHVGREFNMDGAVPRLGADVPRWYGETIGFWDGDTLITWTSNIQGWTTHAAFEHSNQMQTIEIYTPNRDEDGDVPRPQSRGDSLRPGSAVEPVRIIMQYRQAQRIRRGRPAALHRVRADDLSARGDVHAGHARPRHRVRGARHVRAPWAHIWEQYWEAGHGATRGRRHFRLRVAAPLCKGRRKLSRQRDSIARHRRAVRRGGRDD
jgi:hypothetical protein